MKIIEINNLSTKYLKDLAGLLYQQMHDINSENDLLQIEITIKNALKPESRALFFLARKDQISLGMVFINICSGIESGGDYIWINEIQISPEFRSQGIGKKLLNHVLKWSGRNNMKTVLCVADMNNTVSQSLFQSAGFSLENIKWMKKI